MRVVSALFALTTLAVPALIAGSQAIADLPLPTDPALVTGTLDNGLGYVIRRHGNPPGRVAMWLHVASGSLNETEDTRGLAHYLEHMAFNGSTNFPPGSVVPFFQSLGLSFGRDQNAFTGFEQTTYTLTLPDPRPETLDKGFLYLSDIALRLSLLPAEIDSERQIILEEKRARAGPQQRVQDHVLEHLTPGSTLGRRLPIGTESTIRSVTAADFRDYYARWYVPSNMTVIVVGDADPGLMVGLIERHFGGGAKVPRPIERDAGVTLYTSSRAIVATDPELTRAEVSIVRIERARPPTTTVAERRRDLVEQLGTWAFNQRLDADVARGQVAFLEASASLRQQARAIRWISAEAAGKPEAWRAMLRDLGLAVQRARLHGLTEREVQDARTALIAQAEDAAQREATLPAREHLWRINGAVARREPISSAAQRLELLRRLLSGISAREVSLAFAAAFDPTAVAFVAELPAGPDIPSEAELLTLGRQAVDVAPDKPADAPAVTALLDTPPPAGAVVSREEHTASGVLSARLDNGIRVHHRFMPERQGSVTVAITLAGGQIEEGAGTRGITEAAARAWDRPATSRLDSVQIRDLMTGKKVRVTGRAGPDTLTLSITGNPSGLEVGLELAHLLLTDPVLEPAALEQWRESQRQAITARRLQPAGVLAETVADAFYPASEARLRLLTLDQLRAITQSAAQAWLRRLVAEAPIEIAVVGDLDRSAALGLVARYLGSLPLRPRIGDTTLASLRAVSRPPGPIRVERTIATATPQALVLDGFFGVDSRNVRDSRALTLAARILTTRMTRTIREERQLVYSIGASSQPAVEYPGFGRFAAQAPTDPAKGAALASALEAMYSAFAQHGPTPDEMDVARKQIVNQLDVTRRDPEFWVSRLATLDYRGVSLDDVVGAPEAYQQLTASEVRETFARYFRPDARFSFVVGSDPTPAAPRP